MKNFSNPLNCEEFHLPLLNEEVLNKKNIYFFY